MSDAKPQAMSVGPEAARPFDAARIGLRWGAWFWVPFFVSVLFLAVVAAGSKAAPNTATPWQILVLALPPLLVLLICGRWWAIRGLDVGEWAFLIAAIAQGLVLFGGLVLTLFAVMFYDERVPLDIISSDSAAAFIGGWGICSVWMLVLAILASWRVRRAAAKSGVMVDAVDGATTPSGGPRRFTRVLFSSIGIPLLLSVPFIAMLRYDANQHRNANAILRNQIDTIGSQITDLKDLERVKATLLARKQILETIEPHAATAADALAVIGALPAGVQLISLRTHGTHIALDVRCSEPSRELGALEFLARSGYRDLRIAARQREGAGPIGQISIEAISTRGDEP